MQWGTQPPSATIETTFAHPALFFPHLDGQQTICFLSTALELTSSVLLVSYCYCECKPTIGFIPLTRIEICAEAMVQYALQPVWTLTFCSLRPLENSTPFLLMVSMQHVREQIWLVLWVRSKNSRGNSHKQKIALMNSKAQKLSNGNEATTVAVQKVSRVLL